MPLTDPDRRISRIRLFRRTHVTDTYGHPFRYKDISTASSPSQCMAQITVSCPLHSAVNRFEWAHPSPDIAPATPLLPVDPTALRPFFRLRLLDLLKVTTPVEPHGPPKFRTMLSDDPPRP